MDSPFVARCYGIERIDGELYLVVEYIPGRNLGEVRRDGPMDPARVVRIMAELAQGVAAVHARGLIHRDIKPANVILHDDGRPRLVNFGLAAHLGSPRLRQVAGSPPYMAPEQARGHGDRVDHRVNIFGLGGVLYALLTGRPPYQAPDLGSTLKLAEKAEITPPRRLDPKVPAPIEAVCLKAMAAAPENRYGTALEFARGPGAGLAASSGCAACCPRRPAAGLAASGPRPGSGRGVRRPPRPPPTSRRPRAGCGADRGGDHRDPLQGSGRAGRPGRSAWCRSGRSGATPRGSRTWCGSASRSRGRRTAT